MPKVSSYTATLIFPCPNCKNIVSTQDVDMFGKCPECEYDFEEVGDGAVDVETICKGEKGGRK